jgi:hypothetical protein
MITVEEQQRRADTILVELDDLVVSDQIVCLVGVMLACILGNEQGEQIVWNIADTLPGQLREAKAMWHYAGSGP